ncbi:MAG: hypothetical protein CSA32_01815 [Desulfobulbus propionicus]|nr:MAG: hypothetical protein CSA32_01815 [Desulfobulbus propionicus]
MTDNPIVSIIIPCYNQGKSLGETLASVFRQSFQEIEIIVVDDGSDDAETSRIIKELDHSLIRTVVTGNMGLAAARNNGICAAKGQYILPLDADDLIGPHYVQDAVDTLEKDTELGIVYCRAVLFGAVEAEWQLPEFSLKRMLQDNIIFCSAFFRKSDWETVGGYNESLIYGWEDYDFWLRLLELGRKVHRLPLVHFFYRVSADSMVRARPRQHKIETFRNIYNAHQQLFSDNIEAWLDVIVDHQESYREARLVYSTDKKTGHSTITQTRKIIPGPCTLRFSLTDEIASAVLQLGEEPVVVTDVTLHLVTVQKRVSVPWTANADCLHQHYFYFSSNSPQLFLEAGNTYFFKSEDKVELVCSFTFAAFGKDCFAHYLSRTRDACSKGAESLSPVSPPNTLAPVSSIIGKIRSMAQRILLRREYTLIRESGLFDDAYYAGISPDLVPGETDLLLHFIKHGWNEGRNPNPLFQIWWYQQTYPLPPAANPLLHYLERGETEGNKPNYLFFPGYYTGQLAGQLDSGKTALQHYYEHWKRGLCPCPLFDEQLYQELLERCVAHGEASPMVLFFQGKIARDELLPLFDHQYYLQYAPFVEIVEEPLQHYWQYGAEEGCRPNHFFDPLFYRKTYLGGRGSLLDAFAAYMKKENQKKQWPNPFFDPVYYEKSYALTASGIKDNPLLHYQQYGVRYGYYPSARVASLPEKPSISIILPTYNTPPGLLRRCLDSVVQQPYPHWQLCIADDGSTDKSVADILKEYAAQEPRIFLRFSRINQGITAASSLASELATGDFIAFLDHDDELADGALYELALAINRQPAEVYYTDEDLVTPESRHLDTFYKPQFNEELLLGHNYITHFVVLSRKIFDACGGFIAGYDGAQDYDLILRATELARKIVHIPRSLYRWRMHEGSTSINHASKNYAEKAGVRAVEKALARRGLAGDVHKTDVSYFYRPQRTLPDAAKVSLIISDNYSDALCDTLFLAQLATTMDLELVVQHESGKAFRQDNLFIYGLGKTKEDEISWRNQAAQAASGEYLCFLSADVVSVKRGWLPALLEYWQHDFGCVSGMVHADESGKHVGSLPDVNNMSPRYYASFVRDVSVQHNGVDCPQQVIAGNESAVLIRKSVLLAAGGYDSTYHSLLFGHLDLCFRLSRKGFSNFFTPYCAVRCVHTNTVSENDTFAYQDDKNRFQRKHKEMLKKGDPYYPHRLIEEHGLSPARFDEWYLGELKE